MARFCGLPGGLGETGMEHTVVSEFMAPLTGFTPFRDVFFFDDLAIQEKSSSKIVLFQLWYYNLKLRF